MAAAASPAGSPGSAPDSPNTGSGTLIQLQHFKNRVKIANLSERVVLILAVNFY